MIVGFTGTRRGPTPAQHAAMDRFLLRLFVNHGAQVLVHGGAVGCDTFAHHTVTASGLNRDIPILVFPAIEGPCSSVVNIPMGNCLIAEPIPTLERNRIIAGISTGLIAVPATDREEQRSGTWATVRYAREIGCPVYVVRQDGRIVRDGGSVGDKVEHVRRARQTREHQCHWPGCREQVKPAAWGCLAHWRRLPKRFRDEIWRCYRAGQETDMRPSGEYVAVARAAQDWIRNVGEPL